MSTPAPAQPRLRLSLVQILLAPAIWLERARGWKRLALLIAYAWVGLVVVGGFWWVSSLWGLPNVGDPSSATALRLRSAVPEADDATPLYEQAIARYQPFGSSAAPVVISVSTSPFWQRWSEVGPQVHAWIAENREAMELWRRAAERPAAVPLRSEDSTRQTPSIGKAYLFQGFLAMTLLEASRLEEAGDPEGAWAWYRAALRTIRHVGTLLPLDREYFEKQCQPILHERLERWVVDPGVDVPMLRRALTDVLAIDTMHDDDLPGLCAFMNDLIHDLDDPESWLSKQARRDLVHDLFGETWLQETLPEDILHNLARPLSWVDRFLRREPERSRRVARLIFANWIDHFDAFTTGDAGIYRVDLSLGSLELLTPTLGAPPEIQGITPSRLAEWYDSARYLRWRRFPDSAAYQRGRLLREANQGELGVWLAEHLYEREQGQPPAKLGDLIDAGYLDRLPEGLKPEHEAMSRAVGNDNP